MASSKHILGGPGTVGHAWVRLQLVGRWTGLQQGWCTWVWSGRGGAHLGALVTSRQVDWAGRGGGRGGGEVGRVAAVGCRHVAAVGVQAVAGLWWGRGTLGCTCDPGAGELGEQGQWVGAGARQDVCEVQIFYSGLNSLFSPLPPPSTSECLHPTAATCPASPPPLLPPTHSSIPHVNVSEDDSRKFPLLSSFISDPHNRVITLSLANGALIHGMSSGIPSSPSARSMAAAMRTLARTCKWTPPSAPGPQAPVPPPHSKPTGAGPAANPATAGARQRPHTLPHPPAPTCPVHLPAGCRRTRAHPAAPDPCTLALLLQTHAHWPHHNPATACARMQPHAMLPPPPAQSACPPAAGTP
ncbi:hypothetical protein B0H10DRAFT_1955085 [Mycena sp. CBHHK59/15]|nr:hypothetical protein B0H10DRAFT_1955085 [Mycena sp. CBHHK59/15]